MNEPASMATMGPNVLTGREVSIRLGISPSTVTLWVRKGVITPLKRATNGFLFTEDEVKRIEQARQRNKTPSPETP